jgi:hypothetical protein
MQLSLHTAQSYADNRLATDCLCLGRHGEYSPWHGIWWNWRSLFISHRKEKKGTSMPVMRRQKPLHVLRYIIQRNVRNVALIIINKYFLLLPSLTTLEANSRKHNRV